MLDGECHCVAPSTVARLMLGVWRAASRRIWISPQSARGELKKVLPGVAITGRCCCSLTREAHTLEETPGLGDARFRQDDGYGRTPSSSIWSRSAAHFSRASSAGHSFCPHGVRRYSTFGGT